MTPMGRGRFHLSAAGGLALAGLSLAGCTGEVASPSSDRVPSEAEVTAYLQSKAESLYPDVDGLTLTGLRFSSDRTLICGWANAPGQRPLLFTSVDRTPETLERSIGLPPLGEDTPVTRAVRARDMERAEDLCRRNDLLPANR
ncbi:hypothetical protein [Brevundimonas sp.]|uniref:hypothetical protein n=1 Tax=Brevundimonas sp. TaxID=1871086 RepID=UPI002D6C1980|nr:hypothetical protein [Brevundimonas sp.]HYD26138.1 hypothetical protein [Brevundimonas sp.]